MMDTNDPIKLLERGLARDNARAAVLAEAAQAVMRDRNKAYGNPEDNFRHIADLWSAYLWARGLLPRGTFLSRADVATMCGQIKDARKVTSPTKLDNWADDAGYAACGYEAALADERDLLGNQDPRQLEFDFSGVAAADVAAPAAETAPCPAPTTGAGPSPQGQPEIDPAVYEPGGSLSWVQGVRERVGITA